MTADLSRELALALGYAPESVRIADVLTMDDSIFRVVTGVEVVYRNALGNGHWRHFDYRDPTVALPLLEMLMRDYGCDFGAGVNDFIVWFNDGVNKVQHTDTLPEAIARAVIAAKGNKP